MTRIVTSHSNRDYSDMRTETEVICQNRSNSSTSKQGVISELSIPRWKSSSLRPIAPL
jgi:hypothetical protein